MPTCSFTGKTYISLFKQKSRTSKKKISELKKKNQKGARNKTKKIKAAYLITASRACPREAGLLLTKLKSI